MHRKPYNPATAGPQVVHDHRAVDINRGTAGYIVETEVDDPYERGGQISAIRSVRNDPLGDRLARGRIDQAQYLAGREFQKHFRMAEKGPRSPSLSEAIDGTPLHEGLTDSQLKAWAWLSKCYRKLGSDGSALINDMLIHGRTTGQVAASQGLKGAEWQRYYARRFSECLNTLARVYGFANADRPDVTARRPAAPAQP